MRQHGVELAGLRGEIGARDHLPAIIVRDFIEQVLEFSDVPIDRLHEVPVGAIPPTNFLERALARHRVEHAREYVSLTALVAIPKLSGGVVIDYASNIDCYGIEGLDDMRGRL